MAKFIGDEKYMQMALDLAQQGIGDVEPNPAVGCVIVKGNRVIGKGRGRPILVKAGSPTTIVGITRCL